MPMTRGAVEGLWTVTVPLAAGSYQYAFVIDGTTWMSDPAAPIALEDEFGAPSSVVRIGGGRT
jgi:1,4-alpha-glucan branching enzyme